jgi:hypothetical protein
MTSIHSTEFKKESNVWRLIKQFIRNLLARSCWSEISLSLQSFCLNQAWKSSHHRPVGSPNRLLFNMHQNEQFWILLCKKEKNCSVQESKWLGRLERMATYKSLEVSWNYRRVGRWGSAQATLRLGGFAGFSFLVIVLRASENAC